MGAILAAASNAYLGRGRSSRSQETSEGSGGALLVRQIADAAEQLGASAVIAPSHYLADGFKDPWWTVDLVLALRLRRELSRRGHNDSIRLYYRLAIPSLLARRNPDQLASRQVTPPRRGS